MTRALLFLFAVLTAGIAYAVGKPWLYLAAGALLLAAIGLLIRSWQRERRRQERRDARAEAATANAEDDLQSLGIMEIRARESTTEEPLAPDTLPPETSETEAKTKVETETETEDETEAQPAAEVEAEVGEPSPQAPASSSPEPEDPDAEGTDREATPSPIPAEQDATDEEERLATGARAKTPAADPEALSALVRAARLAVGAPVALLLVQEEVGLTYRLEALDAAEGTPPLRAPGTSFSTDEPLLPARAARRSVTRQSMGNGKRTGWTPKRLGYYRRPTEIDEAKRPAEVLLAPLPTAETLPRRTSPPAARFLLVEVSKSHAAEGHAPADGPEAEALLVPFADLLARVIAPEATPASTRAITRHNAERETTAARLPTAGDGHASPDDARPRREIVAEEMAAARHEERDLALALVYLNRAEAIAEHGAEEVRAASRALRARLRRAAPDGRVEPFGELTYGVFYSGSRGDTEAWALALEADLAEAQDPLEGGVSVGLAWMRGPDQDPSALRRNATNALREAYTTGTCTILD